MRTPSRTATIQAMGLALLVGAGAAQLATQSAAAATSQQPLPKAPPTSTADGFSKDQLEQLVAPIALYSDGLLAQILMAATYPIEIVMAERFVKANPGLKDDKLDEALKDQDWDASVKSLCRLPDVLTKMSENLDWTQDLGDAVLGQKTELLDAVQRMRGKAHDAGNLKTTEQQVVTVKQDKIIVIESPSPDVVYVPSYSPTVVYGGWAPPYYYYPPMYPYYPYGAGLVTFGFGMMMGAAIWGGCGWGWGGSDININNNNFNNFNRNTNRNGGNRVNPLGDGGRAGNRQGAGNRQAGGGRSSWSHNPSHRKGANYQNSKVASQYGGRGSSNRVSRDQARGFSGERGGSRDVRTPSGGRDGAGGQRGSASNRAGGGQRSGAADRGAGGQRGSSANRGSGSSYGSRNGAYSGSSRPSVDRGSSSRGSSSRGSRSYSGGGGSRGGSFGGGSRGGGGRGGGGRGGGGGRRN